MDNLFYNHLGKMIIAGILIVVIAIGFFFNHLSQEAKKRDEQEQIFINNCVKSGGKLETVGAWYSSMHLVCYPKT